MLDISILKMIMSVAFNL